MATAKPIASTIPNGRRRHPVRKLMLALALVVFAAAAWFWGPIHARAVAGTAFGARVACSCRYVEGRSLDQCRDDFEPGMSFVHLTEDAESRSVTARLPLLSSQTAAFRAGEGCMLEKWGG